MRALSPWTCAQAAAWRSSRSASRPIPSALEHCDRKAENLKSAVNAQLYDAEKGYYMAYSNILCAPLGLCDDDTARRLIRQVVSHREWGVCQPYFTHFLLEAVDRLGLRGESTLTLLESWKAPVRECPKGLVEGFIALAPAYGFDHSRAWGGTPLYVIPKQLLGLEITEPGYKAIRLNPSLMGLESATVEIPTPFGTISVQMKQGK